MAKLVVPEEVITDRRWLKRHGELKCNRKWHLQTPHTWRVIVDTAQSWRATVCGLLGPEGCWEVREIAKVEASDICKKCLGAIKAY